MITALLLNLISPAQPSLTESVNNRYLSAAKEGFNGSVLVVKGGKVVIAKGYGLVDPKGKAEISANTIFPIGSVTKWFTGMVILRLEQDKKLRLVDKIGSILSGVPADKKGITIQQLLTHSAGFGEYLDRPGEGGDFAPISKKTALSRLLGEKLRFTPGTRSEYSNNGYTMLAIIIEKVTGRSWQEAVREYVFKPANMSRSGFFGDKNWPTSDFAVGYNARTHGPKNCPYYWGAPTWAIIGAGGIVSTPSDLGKAVLALTQGKIVNKANEPRMFVALHENEGFGWMVGKNRAGNPFCNVGGGDNFGFFCGVFYMPTEGNLVVSCINSDRPRKAEAANTDVLKLLR
jgi:CubicO group peptidase (beta-lactamase class C family)